MLSKIAIALALAGATLTSCSHAQRAAFATCEKDALKKDVTVGGVTTSVYNGVAIVLDNGTAGIPAGLEGIAEQLGMPLALDTIQCVVDMLEGTLGAPAGSGSGSAVGIEVETPEQKLAAARAWLAQKRAQAAQ